MNYYKLGICAVIAVFLAIQFRIVSNNSPAWWDEAVYLSMGKYMFSGGASGMWEEIRPPLVPLIAGTLWKLGLNPLLGGRILAVLFAGGSVYLTYLIGRRAFGEKEGAIAAVMLAFTNTFFYFSTLFLSDIFSLCFALLAIYVFVSQKSGKSLFLSGAFAALSFLARFPQAIIAAAIILSAALQENGAKSIATKLKNTVKKSAAFIFGFLALSVPYLLLNQYLYGSMTKPFFAANKIITESYSWLYDFGYAFYFKELAAQNIFLVVSIVGMVYFTSEKLWKYKEKASAFIAFALFLAYFTALNHKEARYVLIFLPYIFIIASFGLFEIRRKLKRPLYKSIFFAVSPILIAAILGNLILADIARINYDENTPAFERNISKVDFGNGPVFSTTPHVGLYTDAPIKPIYYSIAYAQNNYDAIHNNSGFVVFNTCDFPCEKDDAVCPREINKLVSDIKNNSDTIYSGNDTRCEYYIFKKRIWMMQYETKTFNNNPRI